MSRMTRLSNWIYSGVIYGDVKASWGTGVIDSRVPFWTCEVVDDYETPQWRWHMDNWMQEALHRSGNSRDKGGMKDIDSINLRPNCMWGVERRGQVAPEFWPDPWAGKVNVNTTGQPGAGTHWSIKISSVWDAGGMPGWKYPDGDTQMEMPRRWLEIQDCKDCSLRDV